MPPKEKKHKKEKSKSKKKGSKRSKSKSKKYHSEDEAEAADEAVANEIEDDVEEEYDAAPKLKFDEEMGDEEELLNDDQDNIGVPLGEVDLIADLSGEEEMIDTGRKPKNSAEEDEEIERIADSYARRPTNKKGGREVKEKNPTRFNVRSRGGEDDDLDDEMRDDDEDEVCDEDLPKKRGRPAGSGRKVVDFEE